MNEEQPKINIAYTRVSSLEQGTNEAQLEAIKQLVSSKGIKVSLHFLEKKSAKKDDDIVDIFQYMRLRPVFTQLYNEYVKKNKVQNLYIFKWDRLARDTAMVLLIRRQFRKYGTEIIATHDSNESMMVSIQATFSENENDQKKERMRIKQREMAMSGKMARNPSIGFIRKLDGSIYIPPENLTFIHYIFNELAQGKTLKALLRENLTYSSQWKSKVHGGWIKGKRNLSECALRVMIRSPMYYGEYTYMGEKYKLPIDPPISKELWDKVQEQVNSRAMKREWAMEERRKKKFWESTS